MRISHYLTFVLFTVLLLQTADSYAAYTVPDSYRNPKCIVEIGTASYPVDHVNDSSVLQQAIDDVNVAGGGHVVVPAGEYHLMDIQMASDVHVIFRSGVTIHPVKGVEGNIFTFGMDDLVENVSLIGSEDRTVFNFTKATGRLRAVCVNDCNNLRVANLTVNDNHSIFSSITLGWGGVRDGLAQVARNGLIENITANNAHYGYGAIQAHSGESILFRNIKAVGGVAVRLETGATKVNLAQIGGLFDITVEDVVNVNGQAALMFQPHTLRHGDVVARNISSDGSEFAVSIAAPFVSKKKFSGKGDFTPGSFKSITVDGVKAVYRDGPIVTRYPHLKYYPEELHRSIFRVEEGSQPEYRGPSIACVANMAENTESISISNVEAIGFEYHPDIMTPADLFQGSVKQLVDQTPRSLPALRKQSSER